MAPRRPHRPPGGCRGSRRNREDRAQFLPRRSGLAAVDRLFPARPALAGDRRRLSTASSRAMRSCRCARVRKRFAYIRSRSTPASGAAASPRRCCRLARNTPACTKGLSLPSKCATTTHVRSRSTRSSASANLASTEDYYEDGATALRYKKCLRPGAPKPDRSRFDNRVPQGSNARCDWPAAGLLRRGKPTTSAGFAGTSHAKYAACPPQEP